MSGLRSFGHGCPCIVEKALKFLGATIRRVFSKSALTGGMGDPPHLGVVEVERD
jgi:hypothetical protein